MKSILFDSAKKIESMQTIECIAMTFSVSIIENCEESDNVHDVH